MWWMINKEGEMVFTVKSEKDAIARLDDWYTDYVYIYECTEWYED